MSGINERFLRVSVEFARKNGIDWDARYMYFGDGKATVKYLEGILEKLKKGKDDSAGG